jgi:glycosyltransferase involved in cell wall biosynthesis
MPRASVPGAILARLARVPVIVSHEHGSALDGKLARRLLDRQVVARLSTTMLAVSEWDRRNLIQREGIPAQRIVVLPNGIVAPPGDAPDVRPELDIGPGTRLIGAVGRLAPEKGYDELIHAVALLKGQGHQITCVILGDGPYERPLQALIERLGVEAEVRLLGRRPDVWRVIAALEVAVLSSRREGSPLAVLEYMAGAAPIVATAVGGVPELIKNGVHGLLVAPGDPAALATGIARLLDDPELAAALGAAARARQATEFDLAVLVGRLEDLYVELLGQSTVTRRHRRRI